MPSPSRTSRSRRRRCCRTDSRPCCVEVATTLPTRSYPYIRATSSMTSISARLSPRQVGIATVRVSPVPETVKPIGSSSGGRSSAVNVVPMMRLTSLMRTSQERSRSGSAAPRASTAPASTARSGHVSASSSTKRAMDVSICHPSTPRSLRADASERRPRRATLRPMPTGSNQAISNATAVVAALISVSAPPMIPPMPIGTSRASQINRSSGPSRRVTSSSVTICSPSRAVRMRNPWPPSVARSYAWLGWPSSSIT